MSTLLLVSVLAVAQQPGDRGAGADRDRGTATAGGRMEGTWTVVAAERMGRPLTAGKTVTFRNGMLSFADTGTGGATGSGAGGTGTGGTGTGGTGTGGTGTGSSGKAGQGTGGAGGGASDLTSLPSLRLDFGATGTVRVSEAGAGATGSGAGGTTGSGSGTGTGTGGTAGGTTGSGTASGSAAGSTRTGVYVLTQDYLAISVTDNLGGTGSGTGTGTGTGAGGTGTGTGSGGTGTGSSGTGGTAGGQAGTGKMDSTTSTPYLTLILRRTGGTTGSGNNR